MSASSCLGYELSDVASEAALGAVPNREVIELVVELQARDIVPGDSPLTICVPAPALSVEEEPAVPLYCGMGAVLAMGPDFENHVIGDLQPTRVQANPQAKTM